jgi:hypothetical protein
MSWERDNAKMKINDKKLLADHKLDIVDITRD